MMNIRYFALVFLLLFLVTGCKIELDNPVADAKAHSITVAADQDALDSKLAREIDQADADWVEAKRTEKTEYWTSIEKGAQFSGKVLMVFVYIGLIAIASSFAWSVSYGTVKTAQAYGIYAHIRARVVPLDKNGMRPQLHWDDVKMLPADTFLGRIGLQHVRETKYWLNDTATGQSGMIDVDKPASNAQLEVYRQVLIHRLTLNAQNKTALFSKTGDVAEAMGHSALELPDAGQVLLSMANKNLEAEDV